VYMRVHGEKALHGDTQSVRCGCKKEAKDKE